MTNGTDIIQLLAQAMDKYGQLAMAGTDKASILKKGSEAETIKKENVSFQRLKEAALKAGDLLEADQQQETVVMTIPVGAMGASRALAVVRMGEGCVDIAAFFKEGLIKQHGARHAIESIERQLQ